MKCNVCAWNQVKEKLPYCLDHPDPNNCELYYYFLDEAVIKKDNICSRCGKDKDPGRCWWCGNE